MVDFSLKPLSPGCRLGAQECPFTLNLEGSQGPGCPAWTSQVQHFTGTIDDTSAVKCNPSAARRSLWAVSDAGLSHPVAPYPNQSTLIPTRPRTPLIPTSEFADAAIKSMITIFRKYANFLSTIYDKIFEQSNLKWEDQTQNWEDL